MFDDVDLDAGMEEDEFIKGMDELRPKLGEMQRRVRDAKRPVMVVFEGWDSACMSKVINDYIRFLDPRGYDFHPIGTPTEEEAAHPLMWRFTVRTPEKGRIAIFDQSWYSRQLAEALKDKEELPGRSLREIGSFERQLAADHCTMLKFFLHMSKKEHKRRQEKEDMGNHKRCVIGKEGLDHHREYERYLPIVDTMLDRTSFPFAPWVVVPSNDDRYALYSVVKHSIEVMGKAAEPGNENVPEPDESSRHMARTSLKDADLTASVPQDQYTEKLKKYQEKLGEVQCRLFNKNVPMVVAFEGWDAAGKGGAIMRLTNNLDPRGYRVVPIFAPNDVELSHHYLWRFHTRFPRDGQIAIFDRTWYGRVLVERVEGLAAPAEWGRGYGEINEMEEMLVDSGAVMVKFWLQIDKTTQLERFNERETDEHKQWKITPEDWRNREKWDQYEVAVEEMLRRTSTAKAPWTIIESNDKYYSRLKVLKTVIDAAEDGLK